jgi:2-polyprenyl-3-methyl-5-hydroxy-6-metoxy-1,4-benzoquinol methylase
MRSRPREKGGLDWIVRKPTDYSHAGAMLTESVRRSNARATLTILPARMASTTETVPGNARFGFGENWSRFAENLPQERIDAAMASLVEMLGRSDLDGVTFLDIGSGSGLFSLSAALMGAERVHSLDYDPDSVATTLGVRERFAPQANWTVEQASALDVEHMEALGTWDVVYSWGVLHHTGDMWSALEQTCARVAPGGRLFISIYNDQGFSSRVWLGVKRIYNHLPKPLRPLYVAIASLPIEIRAFARHALSLRPDRYLRLWQASVEHERGMSRWHDLVDWVGGYPFEVAKPEEIFDFCASRGFELRKLRTVGRAHGCNEFVFELTSGASGS